MVACDRVSFTIRAHGYRVHRVARCSGSSNSNNNDNDKNNNRNNILTGIEEIAGLIMPLRVKTNEKGMTE